MAEEGFAVAVIGAGPVGLGLAIELGQRGVRVALIERHRTIQRIPKGQNLTQRTMEHMQAWGAETALRAARTIPPEYGIGGLTAYRTLTGPYFYDWLARERVREFYAADNERLPQYETEAVLRARVAEIPEVTTLYGHKVTALAQDDAGVTLTALAETGEERIIRAAYAVGCDGSRSFTREAAGITQTLSDHDRLMVLLVFRSRELNRLLQRFPGKSYYNVLDPALAGYWKFFGRVDLAGEFFFHAPVPEEARSGDFDFAGYVSDGVGAPIDMDISYRGFWDLRFALADTYRAGRVFVAGDAAHSHPPYGGYGVNTGFEDARNLGWKLAARLQGWGGEGLLDSYDAERRPVFESTARDFIARAIEEDRAFLERFDPARDRAAFESAWAARAQGAVMEVGSFEPNYIGSPIVAGEGGAHSARGKHEFRAIAGKHLAPALAAKLASGFTLIAVGEASASATAFREEAARLGAPLEVINAPAGGAADCYEAPLILVRPDMFVAWAGDSAAEAGAALRRAIARADG